MGVIGDAVGVDELVGVGGDVCVGVEVPADVGASVSAWWKQAPHHWVSQPTQLMCVTCGT